MKILKYSLANFSTEFQSFSQANSLNFSRAKFLPDFQEFSRPAAKFQEFVTNDSACLNWKDLAQILARLTFRTFADLKLKINF